MKATHLAYAIIAGAAVLVVAVGPIGLVSTATAAAHTAARATAPDGGAVTWSVAPATVDGPDKRSWVEQEVAAGDTVTEHLALRNLGATTTTFSLNAADGYFTEKGRFNMLQSGQASVDAGTWISVEGEVTVEPGKTVVVPFTIAVPENATPGDHAAGIAASVRSTGVTSEGAQIGVDSRVGFRVITQVPGELSPALQVDGMTGAYAPSWNLFVPGELSITYTAANVGNTQLSFGDDVSGVTTARGNLFPGEARVVAVEPTTVWPLGILSADVIVEASVPSDPALAVAASTETVTVWAVPWLHLASLAGIAIVVLSLLVARRRSKAAIRRLVEDARAEGRREQSVTVGSL